MTDGDVEKRRQAMFEKLNALQNKRELKIEERRKKIEKNRSEKESVPVFLAAFERRKTKLLKILEMLKTREASEEAKVEFQGASAQAEELQNFVADASFFLPPFELRMANETLNDLHERILSLKETILPRKKFSFRSRRKKAQPAKPVVEKNPPVPTKPADTEKDIEAFLSKYDVQNKQVTIHNLTGETIVRTAGEISGNDVWIRRLKDCEVRLLDTLGALRIDDVQNCSIYVGPIAGSAHIENVTKSTLHLATRQIRIHATHQCKFYLNVRSGPIIEDCSAVGFAPYTLEYPQLKKHMEDAEFVTAEGVPTPNMWSDVHDFKWLRKQKSPNWFLIPAEQEESSLEAKTDG